MGAAKRRAGAANTESRTAILRAVERLMLERGHAGVTYRALAAEAGVTPALVQYYFPTLDDVFVSTIRWGKEEHLARLVTALHERRDEPLHVIWDFAREEAMKGLMLEFTVLGNHRKSVRAEIAEIATEVRQRELEAVSSRPQSSTELSQPALVFLLSAIPKLLRLESSLGVLVAHAEIMEAFENYLDLLEPPNGGPTG